MSKNLLEEKIKLRIELEVKEKISSSGLDIKSITNHVEGWYKMVQKVEAAISSKNEKINWNSEDNYFLETWENDKKAHKFTEDIYKILTQGREKEYSGHAIEILKYHDIGCLGQDDLEKKFLSDLDVAVTGEIIENLHL